VSDQKPPIDREQEEHLTTIVHDLRGPLSGIRGVLDFVVDDKDLALPEVHRELFREARNEATRMMNLINEILDFSKIRAGAYHAGTDRVSPALLVRRAVLSVRALAARNGIAVEWNLPQDLPPVASNDEKLLQVLNNLLVNALKFTPAGGLVLVSGDLRADGRVAISVSDTGPGIPFEKQDELFQRFSEVGTATTAGISGSGLGLHITRALVEAHGGQLEFASIPGVGTSFSVVLPQHGAPAPA
jgi:signal transduction histidine kinase